MVIKWSKERKWVVGGCTFALMLAGISSWVSYQNAADLIKSGDRVRRSHEVIEALVSLLATLNEAEAGRRGYILLGDPTELSRYEDAAKTLNPSMQQLKNLIVNHPQQQQQFTELSMLMDQRLTISQKAINTYQRGEAPQTQQVLSLASKENGHQIRQIVRMMQRQEDETLRIWVEESQAIMSARILIELLGSLLSLAMLLLVFGLLYRQVCKRYESEARELCLVQEKALGELKFQFFSMTSHEFRTPLSIIIGSAELLEETLQPIVEPAKLRNLYRIQTYANLMTRLLSDILMLARAEAGRLEFHPRSVEMQSFCLNLMEDMQLLSEAPYPIRFTQQGDQTHIRADEKLLYSILSNLLSNAIKYSPDGKEIEFTLICQPNCMTFRIKDQGIGMSPDLQQVLFQPFHRGDNAKRISGTGLGLVLVKKCLDLHQGEMTIESEVGVGSCFSVTIPRQYNS